jgi:hypothetical protein
MIGQNGNASGANQLKIQLVLLQANTDLRLEGLKFFRAEYSFPIGPTQNEEHQSLSQDSSAAAYGINALTAFAGHHPSVFPCTCYARRRGIGQTSLMHAHVFDACETAKPSKHGRRRPHSTVAHQNLIRLPLLLRCIRIPDYVLETLFGRITSAFTTVLGVDW